MLRTAPLNMCNSTESPGTKALAQQCCNTWHATQMHHHCHADPPCLTADRTCLLCLLCLLSLLCLLCLLCLLWLLSRSVHKQVHSTAKCTVDHNGLLLTGYIVDHTKAPDCAPCFHYRGCVLQHIFQWKKCAQSGTLQCNPQLLVLSLRCLHTIQMLLHDITLMCAGTLSSRSHAGFNSNLPATESQHGPEHLRWLTATASALNMLACMQTVFAVF